MKASLLETLNLRAEQLETLLDLKTPLEKHVDLGKAMHILYKPKQEKTFTEKVAEVVEKTNEVIRDVTDGTLNVAGKIITTTAKIISNPGQTINNVTETMSNTVNEIGATISNTISNTMNNVKTVMNEGILSGDFTDIDLGDDMDDLIGFNRYERPEPIKPEPVSKEPEKKEPEPEPKEQEQVQEEEKQQEEPKLEEPQQESNGWGIWNAAKYVSNTVTSTASYAASWLNPFSYSILGGGKKEEPLPQEPAPKQEQKQIQEEKRELMPEPELDLNDPVTYVQKKQMKLASDLLNEKSLDGTKCYDVFAKLLCYKTLELSLKEGKISADMLENAVSENTVNQNAGKIMKEPAFKKLEKLKVESGFVKRIKGFLKQVSEDPSAVNEIHKDYMQKSEALKASNAPQEKGPAQQKPPEKAPVIGGGPM